MDRSELKKRPGNRLAEWLAPMRGAQPLFNQKNSPPIQKLLARGARWILNRVQNGPYYSD